MNKNILLMLATLTLSISLFDVLCIPTSTTGDTIQVPQDYPTIQKAIDAALSGQTIEVVAGIYRERVTIGKSLTLRGEDPNATIIDGMCGSGGEGLGNVVTVKADNVEISGFTIRNGSYGIYIGYSTACTLRNNHIKDNRWNLAVWGSEWRHYIHDIDSTNLVDGKPVYYWINQRKRRVPTDAGFVAIINSTNITVENLNLTPNEQGVLFLKTEESTIRNVTISKSDLGLYLRESHNNLITNNTIEFVTYQGILLWSSHNNTITGNTLRNGISGINLQTSNNNTVYHNNFINNAVQQGSYGSSNTWDNNKEGNYWSDYDGTDSDHDGIGDIPYTINAGNVDTHPLVGMFSSFNTSLGYHLKVVSNSTIEDFEYFESNSTIKMHVSNMTATQTSGFCRVCIPKGLMSPPYTVIIDDGLTEVFYFNDTIHDNGTHRWIYFAYEHSTHKIDIIPEFPSFLILPLSMIATLLAVIVYRKILSNCIHAHAT